MKIIVAIDPGTTESAYVTWTGRAMVQSEIIPNGTMLHILENNLTCQHYAVHIEMVACYGMPVGKEVFETVLWIGQFVHACKIRGVECNLVYRQQVKLHHCQSPRAKDANVRQVLIDKYGKPGTKKAPGVTYGLKSHIWQAFAIAAFVSESAELTSIDNKGKE